jgi:hypothetical protein
MLAKLGTLANVERDIADVSAKRKEWLQNISKVDENGLDVYIAKLNVLKLRAQLSSLHMTLDVTRMEGHYEAQVLNYLVAATQPLEEEETQHSRKISLQRLQRQDNDVLQNLLEHSLQNRIQMGNINYDLHSQLLVITNEIGLQQEAEQEEFREKLAFYVSRMQSSMEVSKRHYQRITEEYLVLRHNARVAKEVLARSQNDAAQARAELQSCLDGITTEAATQREKMEKNATAELKFLTEDLRADVIRKEIELENAAMRVKMLKSRQKKEESTLKKELRAYKKKYSELQRRRKADLAIIHTELTGLRSMIQREEQRLVEASAPPADSEGSPTAVSNVALESSQIISKLRHRLKELRH